MGTITVATAWLLGSLLLLHCSGCTVRYYTVRIVLPYSTVVGIRQYADPYTTIRSRSTTQRLIGPYRATSGAIQGARSDRHPALDPTERCIGADRAPSATRQSAGCDPIERRIRADDVVSWGPTSTLSGGQLALVPGYYHIVETLSTGIVYLI
jgi:hypothetical protein